jgi:hypothetical protein
MLKRKINLLNVFYRSLLVKLHNPHLYPKEYQIYFFERNEIKKERMSF